MDFSTASNLYGNGEREEVAEALELTLEWCSHADKYSDGREPDHSLRFCLQRSRKPLHLYAGRGLSGHDLTQVVSLEVTPTHPLPPQRYIRFILVACLPWTEGASSG